MLHLETEVWTSKNPNNLVEQDYCKVKQRIYPMLGFKKFANAAVTISRIELAQELRKRQFNIASLTTGRSGQGQQRWEAVLAA